MLVECVFCKIIHGNIKTDYIDKSEFSVAFNDISPQAPVHILIVPKKHISSSLDLDENNIMIFSDMMLLAKKIVGNNIDLKNGFRYVLNTGDNGGQTVDHIHLHLIGGRKLTWPPG